MFRVGARVRIIGAPCGMAMIDSKTGVVISTQPDVIYVGLDDSRLYHALYFRDAALELDVPCKVVPLPLPG
jgi:hypothetical protein